MDVAIILAAGNSTRFDSETPKQLYLLNEKPIINHSIDILSQCLDDVIVVTNTYCSDKIQTNHTILINDVDDRIESIKVALDYIGHKNYNNIIIHDAARPFITLDMINELLESSNNYQHTQYYLELVNGLVRKNEFGWEVAPREDFIELCSPQITNFELFKYIFTNYIETKIDCEILPIMSKLEYDYNLIKGSSRYLKKVTTIDDVY
jgi:2-C-methyl-D-erythritol 4-phosphate cytidylyltransferase/2-C-methyl-D-erythritol 2,4-cyclodiphosphate synthase